MKIQRFNESLDDLYYEPNPKKTKILSDKINNFIIDFSDSTNEGIIEWISHVANEKLTKLTEYKKIHKPKILQELADSKNLKLVKDYANLEYESDKLRKEIKKLEKQVEEFINKKGEMLTTVYNEVFYKFQEDLILNDFDGFYKIIIKDYIDDNDFDGIFSDIHPDIMKKYGTFIKNGLQKNYPNYNEFMMRNDTNKYNL